MNWTLEQLMTLRCVAETGSFSAAARRLGRAQSAVSTAIANLELDLGCELFDRSPRTPRLTPAGEALLHEADSVLAQCQRLEARARTLSQGQEASLTLAIDEALVEMPPVMAVLERLAVHYPSLTLTLLNGAQDEVSQWVEQHRANLGIMFRQPLSAMALEREPLGRLEQVLIVAKDHPLASIEAPSPSDLASHRQLMIAQRQQIDSELGNTPPQAQRFWQLNSFYAMAELATRGLGWAQVPRHIAGYPPFQARLALLDVGPLGAASDIDIELISRRDSPRGPAASWLRQSLRSAFRDSSALREHNAPLLAGSSMP
ncbi:LysR family transcriptional regulator [Cobetia sp. L2A1]|uniref:LysR family transcriptional regulator n=1 Tax=Cobetia sp. L2A1 TaxID=2686360 RepID=UPI00131AED7E|nr:LysR family transcriptional regulator [Cobetia sp. L2A1]